MIIKDPDYRQKLYFALRSRVLTAEEMEAVEEMDFWICVPMNESYNAHEKRIEFMNALVAQFRIRMAHEIAQKTLANSKQADGAGTRKPLTNTTET